MLKNSLHLITAGVSAFFAFRSGFAAPQGSAMVVGAGVSVLIDMGADIIKEMPERLDAKAQARRLKDFPPSASRSENRNPDAPERDPNTARDLS